MVHLLVKHTVEDHDEWKPIFDRHASVRIEHGSQGYQLFNVSGDPNEIVILLDWDSVENAQAFIEESDLREVMEEAGVVGEPEFYFLDDIEAKTPEITMAESGT